MIDMVAIGRVLNRLKREAKKKFFHTVVELTYLLHQLQETANT